MTKKGVMLMRYLRTKGWAYQDLADMFGMSKDGTKHIIRRERWAEVEPADPITGEYLYYTYLKNGNLE